MCSKVRYKEKFMNKNKCELEIDLVETKLFNINVTVKNGE